MDHTRRRRLLAMENRLVIIFAKNIILGKVKTRLAKSVGDTVAFNVYRHLIDITEKETSKLDGCDLHIYFSDVVIHGLWPNHQKFVQEGVDLGQRMQHAFQRGFDQGYTQIVGIGTDLPDLNAAIIEEGLTALSSSNTVFGPSEDGGYYLIGMHEMYPQVFINKHWSTDSLLNLTLDELTDNDISSALLKTLNDVDTLEDLEQSSIASEFRSVLSTKK